MPLTRFYNRFLDIPHVRITSSQKQAVHKNGKTYFYVGCIKQANLSSRISHFAQFMLQIPGCIVGLSLKKSYRNSMRRHFQILKSRNCAVYCAENLPWWNTIKIGYGKWPKDRQLASYERCMQAILKLKMRYAKLAQQFKEDPLFGYIKWVPAAFSVFMKGVALEAAYLSEKNGLTNLFVCASMESFIKKLEDISATPESGKFAFIVPTILSGPLKDGTYFPPNYPQHKVTVGVEKIDGQIRIVILDGSPTKMDSEKDLTCESIWQGICEAAGFSPEELILRAILKCSFTENRIELLRSSQMRQTSYGCEIFSLKDAEHFLQDLHFFERIKLLKSHSIRSNGFQVLDLKDILLPPEFLVVTQSLSALQNYIKSDPVRNQQRFPMKPDNLQNAIKKNRVLANKKAQNHYVTWKMLKYSNLVMSALESMDKEELEKSIEKVYLR